MGFYLIAFVELEGVTKKHQRKDRSYSHLRHNSNGICLTLLGSLYAKISGLFYSILKLYGSNMPLVQDIISIYVPVPIAS